MESVIVMCMIVIASVRVIAIMDEVRWVGCWGDWEVGEGWLLCGNVV